MSAAARRLAGFLFGFALVYTLLMLPGRAWRDAYRTAFCYVGNLTCRAVGADSVRFLPERDRNSTLGPNFDTTVVLTNPRTWAQLGVAVSPRTLAYMPTAIVVALVLATPVNWKRRFRALCLGLLLVSLFAALRVTLVLLIPLSGPPPLGTVVLSPLWRAVAAGAHTILVKDAATLVIVPVLIWLSVTLPRDDPLLLGDQRCRVPGPLPRDGAPAALAKPSAPVAKDSHRRRA